MFLCLARDPRDLEFGVLLAMALRFFVVLAAAKLEDFHLVAQSVRDDRRFHGRPDEQWRANLHRFAVRDHEDLVEQDFASDLGRQPFHLELVAGCHPILLAPGLDHSVHEALQESPLKAADYTDRNAAESKAPYATLHLSPATPRPTLSVSLDPIRALIAVDVEAIEAVIRRRLDSEIALVRQVAEYIIGGGGKRLRPTVLVLAAGACGYHGSHHRELAAVIEFIHTATLLHDDVVDESELRRGRETANAVFGNAASVLVGDFLYSRAFQMMVKVQSMRVMQVLADATNTIAEGEVMQLLNVHDADIEEEAYLDVIRRKTAKLFEAAARLGAVLGDASREVELGLATYGMHLGTAFQIVDDVLDYSGDLSATGKNLGDDLNEGKPTLPLIYAMKHGSPAQAALVRHAIEQGGREEFVTVLEAIRATGALEFAVAQARREAANACAALAPVGDSNYRQSLLDLATFAAERNF